MSDIRADDNVQKQPTTRDCANCVSVLLEKVNNTNTLILMQFLTQIDCINCVSILLEVKNTLNTHVKYTVCNNSYKQCWIASSKFVVYSVELHIS